MLNRFFNGSSPSVPPMYSVGVGDTDDSGTGQKLGLMSKVPFTSGMLFSKSRADTPAANSRCGWVRAKDTGASKHYVTRLQVENFGTVVVGAVHFKAGPNDPASCAQREGQALVFIDAVQSLVNATRDSSGSPPHVIVTGDFNDFTNDPAARDSESNDANSRVLQWIQERLDLRPVSTIVPQADRFTYSASSSFPASQLDHMLVSPSLFSQLHSVSINRSASIFPSLTDHAPLIAVFDVNTQRAVPPATAQCSWLPFQPPACGCGGTCPIMTPSPAATACPSTAAVQASPAAAAGAASEGSAGGVTAGTVALSAAATFFVGLAIGVVLMGARCSGSSCSWHGRPAGRTLGGKHRVARTAGPLAAESELPAFSSQVT